MQSCASSGTKTANIIIIPPIGLESSFTNNNLQTEVSIWNRKTKNDRVSDSNGGYTLPDGSMRAPDVGWVSKWRLMQVIPDELKKFAHVCPDFIIDVRSESDNLNELRTKMQKWLENGVQLGWLVDPQARHTTSYRPDAEPVTKPFTETIPSEDVLVGFTINIQEVLTY